MFPPKMSQAKLADKLQLNEKFIQLKFEWEEPHLAQFNAGQYVSISIPGKPDRRSYSICSSPADEHGFDLLVDLAPNGIGVQYLNSLKFGEVMTCLFPLGMFIVPDQAATKPLHFIATGSGIAPYRSMILDQLQVKKNTQPIRLFWGMRDANQLFWEDEFAELMQSFSNFSFHPVISKPQPEWPLCSGHVTDCLSIHELTPDAEYFGCGNEQMVDDVIALLQTKNIPKEKIHRENFY